MPPKVTWDSSPNIRTLVDISLVPALTTITAGPELAIAGSGRIMISASLYPKTIGPTKRYR